jgi:hypothetical protein
LDEQDFLKKGSNVTWNSVKNITCNKKEFDQDFVRNLYIISTLTEEISEIESDQVDDVGDQILKYAFFTVEGEIADPKVNVESVWLNRDDTTKTFARLVLQENAEKEFENQVKTSWNMVKPAFKSSSFVLVKIKHETEVVNDRKATKLMIFDSIKLISGIIGCLYLDFIKFEPKTSDIFRNEVSHSSPSEDIKVMVKLPFKKIKVIKVVVTDKLLTFKFDTMINDTSEVGSLKNVIKNILSDVAKLGYVAPKPSFAEQEFYYGSYTITVTVPNTVLKELITNDLNFREMCYINESALINTRKSSINIFFWSSFLRNSGIAATGDVPVSLFEKLTGETLLKVKKIPGGPDLETVVGLMVDILNKIFQYSYNMIANVSLYYRDYIPGLNLEGTISNAEADIPVGGVPLKTAAPDIFLPNYTRLCGKPPVIAFEEVDGAMKFPVYGESDPKFYKCENPNYSYPGLIKNRLDNRDKFPYLPCCYQKPQVKSRNYVTYFEKQPVEDNRVNSGEIGKTTAKILASKRIGSLPPKIDKLLLYTTGVKFYRYGVARSKATCLNILNMVTGKNESESAVRAQIASRVDLCANELPPGKEARVVKTDLLRSSEYVSPVLFKRALEDYYNLSYLLFSLTDDDFRVFPNVDIKRDDITLKSTIIFMIEHPTMEHVELIVDEDTVNYVNKKTSQPVFKYDIDDQIVEKIVDQFRQRFDHVLFDTRRENFQTPSASFPWSGDSSLTPLYMYLDENGQSRLVEFHVNVSGDRFVGQFNPLPYLKLPSKNLLYFTRVNPKLSTLKVEGLKKKFPWLKLYFHGDYQPTSDCQTYMKEFKSAKRMAMYVLWCACHVYGQAYLRSGVTVDEWIQDWCEVVERFDYSSVTVGPIYNIKELTTRDGKHVFGSIEIRERIRFNLGLLSLSDLTTYAEEDKYHLFYKDIANFQSLSIGEKLALSKKEYFQSINKPYTINILTTENVRYIKADVMYFIKDFFGSVAYRNSMCLFCLSFDRVVEASKAMSDHPIVANVTPLSVTMFQPGQDDGVCYSVSGGAGSEASDKVQEMIVVKVNNTLFYGLVLPAFLT